MGDNSGILENKIDNLTKKLDEFIERYDLDSRENKEAHAALRKELYGNGDSTGGIKYQVMKNSDMRKNISKFLWIAVSAITIDLIGMLLVLIKMKVV